MQGCRQHGIQGLRLSTRSILARLTAIPDAPLRRWYRPLTPGSPFALDPPAAPRPPHHATTPGPPSLRALTRVPSGATRAHRAVPTTPPAPGGSAFPLKSGSRLVLGISQPEVASTSYARVVPGTCKPCRCRGQQQQRWHSRYYSMPSRNDDRLDFPAFQVQNCKLFPPDPKQRPWIDQERSPVTVLLRHVCVAVEQVIVTRAPLKGAQQLPIVAMHPSDMLTRQFQ